MQAGPLRHRVTIQSPVTATDPFQTSGQASWQNVLTCWASIEVARVSEMLGNEQQTMKVSHIVTIRYPGRNNTIAAGHQILFGARVFSVVEGISNESERNRSLELKVWEINPSAGG